MLLNKRRYSWIPKTSQSAVVSKSCQGDGRKCIGNTIFSPLMVRNTCSSVTRVLKIILKISMAVLMKSCQGDVRKSLETWSKSHPERRCPRAVYRSQAGPILRSLVPLRCGARVKPQGPSLPHLEHTAGDLTWDLDRSGSQTPY